MSGTTPNQPAADGTAVQARGIRKQFAANEALRGFDLEIERGEVVALLGPNGVGKTTAIHILLGLRRADAGSALVLGREPGALEARRRIGATLQEMACPHLLRVSEIVAFAQAHYPEPSPSDGLLEEFRLAGLARRQVGGLSGGERRRLALALAFAGSPELVFLDEPTTGLDVESRRHAWQAITDFALSGGTILLTTHYIEEAEALASRIAVMRDGSVVKVGRAEAIIGDLGAASLEEAFLLLTREHA
jgi:ABC-2 type transport system ATP-binding protein